MRAYGLKSKRTGNEKYESEHLRDRVRYTSGRRDKPAPKWFGRMTKLWRSRARAEGKRQSEINVSY